MSMAQFAIQKEVLETLRTEVLEVEVARRKELRAKGLCSYCEKPLGSEPVCKCASQHVL